MRVAYRRMSGAIGLTNEEKGTRGLWFEKRWALIKALNARGHAVDFVGPLTKPTMKVMRERALTKEHEVFIVEFGSSNSQFYGKHLLDTIAQLQKHRGRVIFLCDDPDLPFIWRNAAGMDWSRWRCWYNAAKATPFGNQPEEVPIDDFPVASLMTATEPSSNYGNMLVYLGRPNGRGKAVKELVTAGVQFMVAGRPKEWTDYPSIAVCEPPDQPHRAAFYAASLGSLVLADSKHKRLGWRTGRAFHAVMAGCPAVCEADHDALSGLTKYADAAELKELSKVWLDPRQRMLAWRAQRDWVASERSRCEKAFEAAGL